MKITPIKNENDYEKALERLEVIFDAAPNSIEGDEAEILSMLIDNYENQHFPIYAPNPIEPKQKLSEKYAGKLPSDIADELQNYVTQSRSEWNNRSI